MLERSPVAMRSGDIIRDRCSSCDKPWGEHPGIQSLCADAKSLKAENEKLRKDLSDSQLTVSAMDMRIKDLLEGQS